MHEVSTCALKPFHLLCRATSGLYYSCQPGPSEQRSGAETLSTETRRRSRSAKLASRRCVSPRCHNAALLSLDTGRPTPWLHQGHGRHKAEARSCAAEMLHPLDHSNYESETASFRG